MFLFRGNLNFIVPSSVARERIAANGWKNVEAVEADATTWRPREERVDFVTFSYSLTMIPDWFLAMDHAHKLLGTGGLIGIVDFYVSRKYARTSFEVLDQDVLLAYI
jgi:S-adenosylmethionine-diacylgycerolhomoserine-N-methlytransferase